MECGKLGRETTWRSQNNSLCIWLEEISASPNQTLEQSHPGVHPHQPCSTHPPVMQWLLRDPHCRHQLRLFPAALGHHAGHSGCRSPFVILLPTVAGRLVGRELSCFHPSPLPLLLDALDVGQLTTECPKKYLLPVWFFFCLLRPPEASFFMNKIWTVLEPWREETTASWCGHCFLSLWLLMPLPWQAGGQGREETAPGFSLGALSSVNCAAWSWGCGAARFVIPCFKQFATEELECFSWNWNYPWFISCSDRITG